MRRPASASRTYGRYAVALRATPDSGAYLDAPTSGTENGQEKINYNDRELTGPGPFRDDLPGSLVIERHAPATPTLHSTSRSSVPSMAPELTTTDHLHKVTSDWLSARRAQVSAAT
jgi:hypothetical protein